MSEHSARAPYSRLPRSGELLAAIGTAAVIASLALPWYEAPLHALDAWETFGATVVLLMLCALGGLALLGAALWERSPALPVAAALWAIVLGLSGVICSIVRLLERPDGSTGLCSGPWVAFGGALLVLAGAWQSLRDERTDRYPPANPPPRKPPPAAP